MRIKVTLDGSGGELDSKTFDLPDGSESDDGSEQIAEIISGWTLSIGDTITIREVA